MGIIIEKFDKIALKFAKEKVRFSTLKSGSLL